MYFYLLLSHLLLSNLLGLLCSLYHIAAGALKYVKGYACSLMKVLKQTKLNSRWRHIDRTTPLAVALVDLKLCLTRNSQIFEHHAQVELLRDTAAAK